MNRIRRSLGIAAVCLALPLWASTANGHGVTLKVHHGLPADSTFHTRFLVPWAQKVEKESGGRIRFRLFPALQMGGGAPGLYDQVKEGVADIVWTGVGDTPERFPAVESVRAAARREQRPGLEPGAVGVRAPERSVTQGVRRRAPAGCRAARRAPVAHAQQARPGRCRPRRSQDRRALVPSIFLSALGATPVEIPAAQTARALASGAVDGALLSWDALTALESGELVKCHTQLDPQTPWLYSEVFVLAMNSATYKSLPEDLRKVIGANGGADTSAWLGSVFDAAATSARELAAERGDAIDQLPAAELSGWRAPAQTLVEDWIKDRDGGAAGQGLGRERARLAGGVRPAEVRRGIVCWPSGASV